MFLFRSLSGTSARKPTEYIFILFLLLWGGTVHFTQLLFFICRRQHLDEFRAELNVGPDKNGFRVLGGVQLSSGNISVPGKSQLSPLPPGEISYVLIKKYIYFLTIATTVVLQLMNNQAIRLGSHSRAIKLLHTRNEIQMSDGGDRRDVPGNRDTHTEHRIRSRHCRLHNRRNDLPDFSRCFLHRHKHQEHQRETHSSGKSEILHIFFHFISKYSISKNTLARGRKRWLRYFKYSEN